RLLARHLAGLAADADRRVGEEAHPLLRLGAIGVRPADRRHAPVLCDSTNSRRRFPRGRRPGLIPTENAFTSWMCTFGSSTIDARSFAAPPVVRPRVPQWYGRPIWCTFRPSTTIGFSRSVTSTRASIAERAE